LTSYLASFATAPQNCYCYVQNDSSPAGLHQCLALMTVLLQQPQPWLVLPAQALLLLPLACLALTPSAAVTENPMVGTANEHGRSFLHKLTDKAGEARYEHT
jgi:hypothetical protein